MYNRVLRLDSLADTSYSCILNNNVCMRNAFQYSEHTKKYSFHNKMKSNWNYLIKNSGNMSGMTDGLLRYRG